MSQLNPQAQQYECFTPGRRVVGRTPKIPIGAAGNPFRNAFTGRPTPQVTQTIPSACETDGIQKSSLRSGFNGKFKITSHRQVQDLEGAQFFLGRLYTFTNEWGKKADLKMERTRGHYRAIWAKRGFGLFSRRLDRCRYQ